MTGSPTEAERSHSLCWREEEDEEEEAGLTPSHFRNLYSQEVLQQPMRKTNHRVHRRNF